MAKEQQLTAYVVLREEPVLVEGGEPQTAGPHRKAWMPFMAATEAEDRVLQYPARSGEQAIKQATAKQDGTHESGRYKAVPVRTWESDVNNLVIRSEVKPVSLFERPDRVQTKPQDEQPEVE